MPRPRLTLLVITYNRIALLRGQLGRLIGLMNECPPGYVELVVSDNQSSDGTDRIVPALMEGVAGRFVRQGIHHWSAEGHVRAAVGDALGDYIWIISDDDWIDPASIRVIMSLLERQPSYVFLNPTYVDIGSGTFIKPSGFLSAYDMGTSAGEIEMSYDDLIRKAGFMNVINSYSCSIASRELLARTDWEAYFAISPLGSLVPIFLEAFGTKSGYVVMSPMVHFTLEPGRLDGEFQKFFRISAVLNQPSYYWWFLYPALFLDTLIRRGVFERSRFSDIVEVTFMGRDTLANAMLHGFCAQLAHSLDHRDPREQIQTLHLDLLGGLFSASDSTSRYSLSFNALKQIAEQIITNGDDIRVSQWSLALRRKIEGIRSGLGS